MPVIAVGRDATLDLNPLAWEPGLDHVFRDPGAIRAEVRRLLSLSADDRAAYVEHGKDVLRRSFSPVDDQTMQAFLAGLSGD